MESETPKDLAQIWPYREAQWKSGTGSGWTVLDQYDSALAGRPAKFVAYSIQQTGMPEPSKIIMAFVVAESSVYEITYTGLLSNYDQYWPAARTMLDSLQIS
jgi:hypothetical protein